MYHKILFFVLSFYAFKDVNVEPCNLAHEEYKSKDEMYDYTNPIFYKPVELSPEERSMVKMNQPVVIEYAVRPSQWLLLMNHD
ncbi:hypothetical protein TUBRATIS_004860 [Tubulinosema ratisbonensis]|uniref:Uncharacterized protein n=1 Tax=Tubulinosema ratisbonensis TaxID=291195 RepID=A0A437AP39_9MICR|nr:hypothetical protein TUBRATIS_004860 [Tubulinosema ratisbonensis]